MQAICEARRVCANLSGNSSNWRHRSPSDQYPRYEPLRERFNAEFAKVAEFLEEKQLGKIRCNQCEVTYINVISLDDGEPGAQLSKIFTFWSDDSACVVPGSFDRGSFGMSFIIDGEVGGDPFGRLHVDGGPVLLPSEDRLAFRVVLTTRGNPADETVESVFAWLDRAREVGVRVFTSITTEYMHRLWERRS